MKTISKINIYDFLKTGASAYVSVGESAEAFLERNGDPEEIEEYGKGKGFYYHYKYLRVSFSEGGELLGMHLSFGQNPERYKTDGGPDGDVLFFSQGITLSDIFLFLQQVEFDFSIIEPKADPEYLKILVNNSSVITYDLENDCLDMISSVQMSNGYHLIY